MKAILKYPGGKWRIAQWIISQMPPHKVYLEPYFGSGAIFFNKPTAAIETINDINSDVVNLFRVCRDNAEELAALIALTPFARQEYINCYARSDNPIEQARRTLVRYWQSYGTSNSSLNSFKNSQAPNSPDNAGQWAQLPGIIASPLIARLKAAQIENVPAIELIKRYSNPDTLIYADPPYLQSLRKRNLYKEEMSDGDHLALLDALKATKSKVILSAYDSGLYNEALQGWYTTEIKTIVQAGQPRTEKLYINFAPPSAARKVNDNFEAIPIGNGYEQLRII